MIGPPKSAAEAVVVVTRVAERIRRHLGLRNLRVDRVQVAVLEVLVSRAVELVGSALDGLVELTTGRVTELRRELVLQNGEAVDRVVRNRDERTGHRQAVVVHAFYREVVVAGTLSANRRTGTGTDTAGGGHAGIRAATGSARRCRSRSDTGQIGSLLGIEGRRDGGRRGIDGHRLLVDFDRGAGADNRRR